MCGYRRKVLNFYENANPRLRRLAGSIIRSLPHRLVFGREFVKWREYLKETEYLSAEQLKRMQESKLREILLHAFRTVPYYKRTWTKIGITEKDLEDLNIWSQLPFIDKSTIKNNFKDFISSEINKTMRDYTSTGGSSGEPFYFYINSNRSAIEWAFLVDQWSRVGFNLTSKRATFRGLRIQNPEKALYHDDPLFKDRRYSSFHLNERYIKRIWPTLLNYQPDFIYAYPSSALIVAQFILENSLDLPSSLQGVLLGSENIYEGQREIIEQALRCDTFLWYGHCEKLVLAGECEHENVYHAYPQYGFVEFITKDEKTAKPGDFAEIVGTGFINTVMPMIRYRTGDWATYLGDYCTKCGRNYSIFRDVRGRWTQEMLVGKDGNLISISALNIHSNAMEKIARFQYRQNLSGKATLRLVIKDGFSEDDRRQIFGEIQGKLEGTVDLEIEIVENIPLTERGKYKYVDQQLKISIPKS